MSASGPIHAFFDFDDTLASGDSILYWMRFYYSQRPKRRIFQLANGIGLALYLLRFIDSRALKRLFLWPLAFEKPAELDRLAQKFVLTDLARRFHKPVLQRLWSHHLLGHQVVIISASATFYLKHLQALLPPVRILGTEMLWPEKGLRFPRYRDGNLKGSQKVELLKTLGYAEAGPLGFAYSDHHHDMPLLAFAEFPTCVFPTPTLRRRAKTLGWPVWTWPGRPKPWKTKANKLGLLLFAAEWFPEIAEGADQALPGLPPHGHSQVFLIEHAQALRARVLEKYHGDAGEKAAQKVLGPKWADYDPVRVPRVV